MLKRVSVVLTDISRK